MTQVSLYIQLLTDKPHSIVYAFFSVWSDFKTLQKYQLKITKNIQKY